MADISSDADLRAYLRSELKLTDSGRVPDEDIDAEISFAKKHISEEIAMRVEDGNTLTFYNPELRKALFNFLKVRMSPISRKTKNPGNDNGRGPPPDKIPKDHPQTVSHIQHTDFKDNQVNFWRDRMVRALNNI